MDRRQFMKAAVGVVAGVCVGVYPTTAKPMIKNLASPKWTAGCRLNVGDLVAFCYDGTVHKVSAHGAGIILGRKVRDSGVKLDFVSWSVPNEKEVKS